MDLNSSIADEENNLRNAVNAAERLGRLNHRRLEALTALADHYTQRGRLYEAEPLWVNALSFQEKIFGPEHQTLARPLVRLSHLYEKMGRYAQGAAVLRLALKIFERDSVENSVQVADCLVDLSRAASRQERWEDAETHLARAQNIARIVHGEKSPALARVYLAWGELQKDRQNHEGARVWIFKAIENFQRVLGDRHPGFAEAWTLLGHVERDQKHYDKAEALYQRAQEYLRGEGGGVLQHLGRLYLVEGNPRRAIRLLRPALALRETALGAHHPDVAELLVLLAEADAARRAIEKAEVGFLRAWEIFEKTLGSDAPGLLQAEFGLAALYFDRSCYEEADRLFGQLVRTQERIHGPHHPAVRAAITNARISLEAQDRYEVENSFDSLEAIGGPVS